MPSILYATDFSLKAEKALTYALDMAVKHKAELWMLHVITASGNSKNNHEAPTFSTTEDEIKTRLKNLFLKHASGEAQSVIVDFVVHQSTSVTKGILQVVTDIAPLLLVVGADESEKALEFITGSTIMNLIKKSDVPVLAIPEHLKAGSFDKIFYATDLYDRDISALQELVNITRPFSSKITLLHITSEKESKESEVKMQWFKELVNERITNADFSFQRVIAEDVQDGLTTMISEDECQLLVMMEKERTGFLDQLFHQDLIEQMELRLPVPLLSFNEKNLQNT